MENNKMYYPFCFSNTYHITETGQSKCEQCKYDGNIDNIIESWKPKRVEGLCKMIDVKTYKTPEYFDKVFNDKVFNTKIIPLLLEVSYMFNENFLLSEKDQQITYSTPYHEITIKSYGK